ncbi:sensor domain-containing protein [Streptomyces noursei]|uniref:sensor histidine kinase n=1 Tax=Streptomyces noursei TaxID=1971 RepID=UPI003326FA63
MAYLFLAVLSSTAVATRIVIGAGVLPETVLMLRGLAGFKRRRVAAWTGVPVPAAYPPLRGGLGARVCTALPDPGTVRDLRWLGVHFTHGWLPAYACLPLWPLGLVVDGVWCGLVGRRAVVLPLIARLADLDATWSRALLTPTPEAPHSRQLAARVEKLTVLRAGAVAAHGAELRRIERVRHDGAQARLVALSMRLGLARRMSDADPEAARTLPDDAQDQTEEARAELRHVVRGLHPPILTDRGLAGAIRALAAGSGLSVAVREDGLAAAPLAPAAVEAAAYFVVAEALTNAAKHSGTDRAAVELTRTPRALRVRVRDGGRGGARTDGTAVGADPGSGAGGTGPLGMRRRVAALDGTLDVASPVGGPTVAE